MRDVYEILREKEAAVERVRREIEALQFVSHLLQDEADASWDIRSQSAMPGGLADESTSFLAHDEEDLPAELTVPETEAVANDGRSSTAKVISRQLKRIAQPLFGTLVSSFRP